MNAIFGEAVKRYRLAANLTIMDLARRVGINHGHLSRIEASARDPRVSIARRIADALGVSLDELCPAGSYSANAKKSSKKPVRK